MPIIGGEKRTCGACGSEYELHWVTLPYRDNTLACSVCNAQLESWSGASYCTATLLKAGKAPERKP